MPLDHSFLCHAECIIQHPSSDVRDTHTHMNPTAWLYVHSIFKFQAQLKIRERYGIGFVL